MMCGLRWRNVCLAAVSTLLLGSAGTAVEHAPESPGLLKDLNDYTCKIVYESFRDGNWDLWLMNADGSEPVNLTKTADVDEMYPKASPDGTTICFVADVGKGAERVRGLCLMNSDGTGRKTIVRKGRWPCWSPDGKTIAYLAGPKRYSKSHNATGRMHYYDPVIGKVTPHVNKDIARLLCPTWSPDGKWLASSTAGGMGFGSGIIAFQADGLGSAMLLPSKSGAWQCRPDFAPDGKRIAYAKAIGVGPPAKVFAIEAADIDLSSAKPMLSNRRHLVTVAWPTEVYHVDWSPGCKYVALSRGPREMNRMKPQRPIIGIKAPGWDICVLEVGGAKRWVKLTTDGMSNKEPDWVRVRRAGR